MLDKIRVHAQGELPADYVPNLGKGFDHRCVSFLRFDFGLVVFFFSEGGSDEEILQWCFASGRLPTPDEIHVWNEFMRKVGWNDDTSETLTRRK